MRDLGAYTGLRNGWSRHLKYCRRCSRKLHIRHVGTVTPKGAEESERRLSMGICYRCYRKVK